METLAPNEEPQRLNPQEVYDLYRTSLMNKKFYAHHLLVLSRWNLIFEIAIALGASGSGVAGYAFFDTPNGKFIWAPIALAAAVLATLKPIFGLSGKIQKYTELWSGYNANFISLKRLVSEIRDRKYYAPEHRERFNVAYDRHEKLSSMDVVFPSRKLLTELQKEVIDELPTNSFWWPSSA